MSQNGLESASSQTVFMDYLRETAKNEQLDAAVNAAEALYLLGEKKNSVRSF